MFSALHGAAGSGRRFESGWGRRRKLIRPGIRLLTGNRLRRILDRGSDGAETTDEVAIYGYDANDRFKTEYLDDPDNPTGYSRVLKETTLVAGQVRKTIVHAIGHAVVSQTTPEYSGGPTGVSMTLVLGRDGRGST